MLIVGLTKDLCKSMHILQINTRKVIAGKKGADAKWSANGKTMTPIPIPKPIPNNKYSSIFEELWKGLIIKRGSKWKANIYKVCMICQKKKQLLIYIINKCKVFEANLCHILAHG